MEENEKKKIIVKAKTNTTISEIAKKQICPKQKKR